MHSLILLALLALCALHDIRDKRIPNALTIGGGAVALTYLAITGHSWLGASIDATAVAFILSLLLSVPGYLMGRLGAGDVKLLALIALASDTQHLLHGLIGAGLAYLTWTLLARHIWPTLAQTWRYRLGNLAPEHFRRYPFAPFLFVGVLASIL